MTRGPVSSLRLITIPASNDKTQQQKLWSILRWRESVTTKQAWPTSGTGGPGAVGGCDRRAAHSRSRRPAGSLRVRLSPSNACRTRAQRVAGQRGTGGRRTFLDSVTGADLVVVADLRTFRAPAAAAGSRGAAARGGLGVPATASSLPKGFVEGSVTALTPIGCSGSGSTAASCSARPPSSTGSRSPARALAVAQGRSAREGSGRRAGSASRPSSWAENPAGTASAAGTTISSKKHSMCHRRCQGDRWECASARSARRPGRPP